ncbi:MAG: hypothetical protein GC172_06290 [Phycisphaera sp.]|nr:hypothetical protein [Phycisphaera sp.]
MPSKAAIESLSDSRAARALRVLALVVAAPLSSCGKPAEPPVAQREAPAAPAAPADAKGEQADPNLRVSKELWPNGKVKYTYEMRKGADGKWARNGTGRAYYESGPLEREGLYRNNVRVGKWTYYAPDGSVLRVEERGDG